jgi:hypothetical protein
MIVNTVKLKVLTCLYYFRSLQRIKNIKNNLKKRFFDRKWRRLSERVPRILVFRSLILAIKKSCLTLELPHREKKD